MIDPSKLPAPTKLPAPARRLYLLWLYCKLILFHRADEARYREARHVAHPIGICCLRRPLSVWPWLAP